MASEDDINLKYYSAGDEFSEYRVICKGCGMSNLRWEKENNKWTLMELRNDFSEIKHVCNIPN